MNIISTCISFATRKPLFSTAPLVAKYETLYPLFSYFFLSQSSCYSIFSFYNGNTHFAKNLCTLALKTTPCPSKGGEFYRKGAKDNRKGRKIRLRVFVSSCLYLTFLMQFVIHPKYFHDAH